MNQKIFAAIALFAACIIVLGQVQLTNLDQKSFTVDIAAPVTNIVNLNLRRSQFSPSTSGWVLTNISGVFGGSTNISTNSIWGIDGFGNITPIVTNNAVIATNIVRYGVGRMFGTESWLSKALTLTNGPNYIGAAENSQFFLIGPTTNPVDCQIILSNAVATGQKLVLVNQTNAIPAEGAWTLTNNTPIPDGAGVVKLLGGYDLLSTNGYISYFEFISPDWQEVGRILASGASGLLTNVFNNIVVYSNITLKGNASLTINNVTLTTNDIWHTNIVAGVTNLQPVNLNLPVVISNTLSFQGNSGTNFLSASGNNLTWKSLSSTPQIVLNDGLTSTTYAPAGITDAGTSGAFQLYVNGSGGGATAIQLQGVGATHFLTPVTADVQLGYSGTSFLWEGSAISTRNRPSQWWGYSSGTGSADFELSHTGTNGVVLLNSVAINDAGVPKAFSFASNGVQIARINMNSGYTGTGTNVFLDNGMFGAVPVGGGGGNWVASGSTNSTLSGIATAYGFSSTVSLPYNLKIDAGAKGDGTNDDTAVIQAAFDTVKNRPIYAPSGTYLVNNLTITNSGFFLYGDGTNTVFKGLPTSTNVMNMKSIWVSTNHQYMINMTFKDFWIDMRSMTNADATSGLIIRDTWNVECNRVNVVDETPNAKWALQILDNVYTTTIKSGMFNRIKMVGFSTSSEVTTVDFITCSGNQLVATNVLAISFLNPVFQGGYTNHFSFENANGVTLLGGDYEGSPYTFNFGTNVQNVVSIGNTAGGDGDFFTGTWPTYSYFADKRNTSTTIGPYSVLDTSPHLLSPPNGRSAILTTNVAAGDVAIGINNQSAFGIASTNGVYRNIARVLNNDEIKLGAVDTGWGATLSLLSGYDMLLGVYGQSGSIIQAFSIGTNGTTTFQKPVTCTGANYTLDPTAGKITCYGGVESRSSPATAPPFYKWSTTDGNVLVATGSGNLNAYANVAGYTVIGPTTATTTTPTKGIRIDPNGNMSMLWRNVMAKTTNFTLPSTNSFSIFTNDQLPSGLVTNTLPSGVAGYQYTFICATNGMYVLAPANNTIIIAGTESAAAGWVSATNRGSALTLVAINSTNWVATAHEGTWTFGP